MESDFSAIHRVDDIYQLEGPAFFRKAWRMSAYQGVMKMRVEEKMQKENPGRAGLSFAPSRASSDDEIRHLTPEQMLVEHPGLFDLETA